MSTEAQIRQAVENVLAEEVKSIGEKIIEQAAAQVQAAIRERVAQVALNVMSHYSVERNGNVLLIRVEIDTNQRR